MTRVLPLAGACILVTRPRGQAEALCRLIAESGGVAERLAPLEIVPSPLDDTLAKLLGSIDAGDLLVFVSPNAVAHGMDLLAAAGVTLPAAVDVAAVGRASAAALASRGVSRVSFPSSRSNSEELLECEMLKHVRGRRVIIFRGQDGRELLADTLRRRGARVDYAPVYRRVPSALDFAPVLRRWLDGSCPVLVLTSAAAARVLVAGTPDYMRARLFDAPVAVFSDRLAEACREAGWRGAIAVCRSPGDSALVDTIAELIRSHCRS